MTPAVPGEPAEVVLVAMPFALVNIPSIQIGTLASTLARAGIAAAPLSLHLAFAEHLARAGLDLGDYQRLAYGPEAVVEWVFAVPPFRPTSPEDDAAYLAQRRAVPGEDPSLVDLAERARARSRRSSITGPRRSSRSGRGSSASRRRSCRRSRRSRSPTGSRRARPG
jgi:hypothetical protein